MTNIRKATKSDLTMINHLAHEIWWDTYKGVISDEQIEFMLSKMYSIASLEEQINAGNIFLVLNYEGKDIGFAAYAKYDIDKNYKLEKLYLNKTIQGKGLGNLLIKKVEEEVKNLGASYLYLNVNRNNNAFTFYQKVGYEVVEEVDIPYFGFVLNDYIMRKALK
jgi:GNAT superfamily N-acetyltransferase